MSTINRKMKREAAKKAFRHNRKMSDVNKELVTIASEETFAKMTVDITRLMVRAFCLTELLRFKEITKKETRLQKSIAIAHEYTQKIVNKQLTKEEYDLLLKIDKEFNDFSAAKAKKRGGTK